MKKAAILGMAAFYLFLTTGMFVCAMHCTAGSLLQKPGVQMAGKACCMHHAAKQHTKTNDNDCCKHHSNYVVKENIKPVGNFSLSPLTAIGLNCKLLGFTFRSQLTFPVNTPFNDSSPPWRPPQSKYIQYRSLLI